MKWFKHDSNANMDDRLQEVLLDYGLEGYGLYWYCIELISSRVETDSLTFELKHDARVIARNTGSTPQKVQEMMTRFVDMGLFESSDGVITCLKLAKRLDQSMTSNPAMRKLIKGIKNHDESANNHDGVMTESDKVMQDKIRLEKIRKEEDIPPIGSVDKESGFDEWWSYYPKKQAKADANKAWLKNNCHEMTKELISDLINRSANHTQWQTKKFIPNGASYLNGKRWEDEIITDTSQPNSNKSKTLDKNINNCQEWISNEQPKQSGILEINDCSGRDIQQNNHAGTLDDLL